MRIITVLVGLLAAVFVNISLSFANERETVFVSILPQKYFVQQICKDRCNVEVMVQPGASPATYEPKSSQMVRLARSKAYFSIGVPFERAWLDRIAGVNPQMKIIHTDAGIDKLHMVAHHHKEDGKVTHDASDQSNHDTDVGHHHDTEQEGFDPHIWLSPSLVKQQARIIAEGLTRLFPAEEVYFTDNLATFLERIDQLDQDLKMIMADLPEKKFMVFHPSWGYFARDYGLEQIAIEIEGKDPKLAQLKELISHARENEIRVVFAQPQFSTKSAEIIAGEIEGSVILIDPLAENWLDNLRLVADKFRRVLN